MDYDPYSVSTLPRQEPFHGTLDKGKSKENQEDDQSSITSYQGKVQVELEDGTLEDLDLSSYVDVAGIKQRRMQAEKPGEEEQQKASKDKSSSNIYTAADERKKITPKGKGVGKKKKALAQIVGMIGEPEVDMRKVLMETNVVLPLFQQMQISPWFRDEQSRLGRAPHKSRKAKPPVGQSLPEEGETNMQGASKITVLDSNSYSVRKHAIQFVKDMASRKSMAYVYLKFVQELSLALYPVSKLGVKSLTMHTSDGSKVALKHWVKFHTEVGGIYRHIWGFVAPHDAGPLSLLLGLKRFTTRVKMKKSLEKGYKISSNHGGVQMEWTHNPTSLNVQCRYKLQQINGESIKGSFHGDHLRKFRPREGYLVPPIETLYPTYQNLRSQKKKKRPKINLEVRANVGKVAVEQELVGGVLLSGATAV